MSDGWQFALAYAALVAVRTAAGSRGVAEFAAIAAVATRSLLLQLP